MKKLIVIAHPNSHGFTHQIARRFIEVSEEKGHETFLMNLYDPERKQDYLMLDDHGKQMGDDKRDLIHAKITRADELVFVFPLRWFDAPAIMKNWFDVNVSTGFAYRFKKDSLLPHRYLKGKSARIIFTAWSPWFVIRTAGIGILINWAIARLYYVGITLRSYTVFGKVPQKKTPEEREKMLAKVANIARR